MKGEHVVILQMTDLLQITDFFVIGSGLNERHLKAMAGEIDVRIKKEDERLKNHAEGLKNPRWALLDYGSVVVHLMHPDAREYYDLEFRWAEAPRVEWREESDEARG
jgi:ribosome-associated protein